ncbi:unnamed protein product, partial [Prunus brigantina]
CSKIQRFNKTNIKALQLAKRNANNNESPSQDYIYATETDVFINVPSDSPSPEDFEGNKYDDSWN